jgi:hypothetical protein
LIKFNLTNFVLKWIYYSVFVSIIFRTNKHLFPFSFVLCYFFFIVALSVYLFHYLHARLHLPSIVLIFVLNQNWFPLWWFINLSSKHFFRHISLCLKYYSFFLFSSGFNPLSFSILYYIIFFLIVYCYILLVFSAPNFWPAFLQFFFSFAHSIIFFPSYYFLICTYLNLVVAFIYIHCSLKKFFSYFTILLDTYCCFTLQILYFVYFFLSTYVLFNLICCFFCWHFIFFHLAIVDLFIFYYALPEYLYTNFFFLFYNFSSSSFSFFHVLFRNVLLF